MPFDPYDIEDDAIWDAILEDRDERHRRRMRDYDEEGEECLTVQQRNPTLR